MEYTDVLFASGYFALFVGDLGRGRVVGQELLGMAEASGSIATEHDANKLLGLVVGRERKWDETRAYAERHCSGAP